MNSGLTEWNRLGLLLFIGSVITINAGVNNWVMGLILMGLGVVGSLAWLGDLQPVKSKKVLYVWTDDEPDMVGPFTFLQDAEKHFRFGGVRMHVVEVVSATDVKIKGVRHFTVDVPIKDYLDTL